MTVRTGETTPLIVPMQLEAMVVNDALRTGGTDFQRCSMAYDAMQSWASGGLDGGDNDFTKTGFKSSTRLTTSDYYNGAYLKWRLPDALTSGVQDNRSGRTHYPFTPNRWLVTRRCPGAPPVAWIVESDAIRDGAAAPMSIADEGSKYMDAYQPGVSEGLPRAVTIGRATPLTTAWTESGKTLGLTAVSPGNTAFAAYQPTCHNVFSFVDCLNDFVDPCTGKAPTAAQPALLSYTVVGWFSDTSADPLAGVGAADFADTLERLKWALPPQTPGSAEQTLYAASLFSVAWHNEAGQPPASGLPDVSKISVSVGDTSIQALTALVAMQAGPDSGLQPELFEAFQYDLLRHIDDPDGQAVLAEKLRAAAFRAYDGGYGWGIVDDPEHPDNIGLYEHAIEAEWLAALNRRQAELDDARRALSALQRELYVAWWKDSCWATSVLGPVGIPGLSQSVLDDMINPATPGSLAARVVAQLALVQSLGAEVPGGLPPAPAAPPPPAPPTPQDILNAEIQAFADKHALPKERRLKRFAKARFHQPTNPVVLLAGAGAAGMAVRAQWPVCRFPSQAVTGLVVNGKTLDAGTPGLSWPRFDLSGIHGAPWTPDVVQALLDEAFFIDPGSAPQLAAEGLGSSDKATVASVIAAQSSAAGVTGVLPTSVSQWSRNPWRPVRLNWEVRYFPIDYGTTSAPNWSFEGYGEAKAKDGFVWSGKGIETAPLVLAGAAQLTPHAAYNLQARVQAVLDAMPDLDPKERAAVEALLAAVQTSDQWDLVSQALDGFNAQLRNEMLGVYFSPAIENVPNPPISTLIGDAAGRPPEIGDVPPTPAEATTDFQPWRAGVFVFTSLQIVDEWGQALKPVNDATYQTAHVARPADMVPDAPALAGVASPIQLDPGLLQPARLDFDLVSASDDGSVLPLAPDANPICGWVLPNHLDRALSIYAQDGGALGELNIGMKPFAPPNGSADDRVVNWTPASGAPWATVDELAQHVPHLGPFVKALKEQTPAEFNAFMSAIDETLWTTMPIGAQFDKSLAVLLGRPLALVRTRLQFTLDGLPVRDPSWQFTLDPAPTPLTGYSFPIQLGDTAKLEDGLIGYFTGDDYSRFNIVEGSGATADGFLKPIGENNNYVYMPFDGRTVTMVSLLIDPRGPVHALTGILPDLSLGIPQTMVDSALAAMDVTFRAGPLLTERSLPAKAATDDAPASVILPLPALKTGVWSWQEREAAGWIAYPVTRANPTARITDAQPTLRRGLLKLSKDL